ncbi:MAG: GIY-YIG nuclease family protein [Faecousia sp.]
MSIYKPGRPAKYNPADRSGEKPPAKPGEYRIRDAQGDIAYVGETNNLQRRAGEHLRSGKLPADGQSSFEYKIADGRSTSKTRRAHEQEKIAQHQPSLNKSKGGEGRPARK